MFTSSAKQPTGWDHPTGFLLPKPKRHAEKQALCLQKGIIRLKKKGP